MALKPKTLELLSVAKRTRKQIENRAGISGKVFRRTKPAAKKAKITKARKEIANRLRSERKGGPTGTTLPANVRIARRLGFPNLP
mgnify:CR=1 FL=1